MAKALGTVSQRRNNGMDVQFQDANYVTVGGVVVAKSPIRISQKNMPYMALTVDVRASPRKGFQIDVYAFGALAKKIDKNVFNGQVVVVTAKFNLDRKKRVCLIMNGITKWDETYIHLAKDVTKESKPKNKHKLIEEKTRLYVETRSTNRGDGLF